MTEINHQAVTGSIAAALTAVHASQQAVKKAAAEIYTTPAAPAAAAAGTAPAGAPGATR